MKTIIAGSRTISDLSLLKMAVDMSDIRIAEVVSGHAEGVDRMGEDWAIARDITVKYFPAEWGRYGKAAEPIRNRQMAAYADALIAVWDGESRGTKSMVEEARKAKLRIFNYIVAASLMSNAGHGFLIETSYDTVMEANSEKGLLDWAEKRFADDPTSIRKLRTFLMNGFPGTIGLPGYSIKRR